MLFECFTGHTPFVRDQEIVVMWAHLRDEPPAVTTERPDLPAALDAVIARAMAKAPAERYESCTAMVQAVGDAVALAPAADDARAEPSPLAPREAADDAPTRGAQHPACIREALEDAQLWPNLRSPRRRT